jgi:streptogramin lyase
VNLHGDMVVTNRDPQPGPSSVTKFAAEKQGCVDRNGNGSIDTSTGPSDVKPWGEDECMLWNTPLPDAGSTTSIGARATAWDGTENPETGEGGFVWIGALMTKKVYKLDGGTGELLATASVELSPYGGAMDGRGSYWLVAAGCTIGLCRIGKLNMRTFESAYYQVPCGYGISVDARGRVWTAGMGCVNRFDPATETSDTVRLGSQFNRGIAVDNNGSVWAAVTDGRVVQVREDTLEVVNNFTVGASEVVGVAVDFEGFIWAIDHGSNQAMKIDPATYAVEAFPVGSQPYTYSDMTGFQLSTVIFI